MFGSGSVFFGGNTSKPGTPATVTAANNGTSLAGTTVQLGQPLGALGSPGKLLNEREIPFNGFPLLFDQIGQVAGAHFILRYDPAAPANGEPFIEFQDGTGVAIAVMRFQTVAGGNNIDIGLNNGLPAGRNMYQIGTNIDANGLANSRDCIFIGTNVLEAGSASLTEKLIVIGHDSLNFTGAYGSYILIYGHDVFDAMAADSIGTRVIAVGNFINNAAYPGGGLGNDVIIIGQNVGAGGAATDLTILGDAFVTSLSHVAFIGTPTQNVIIGGALAGETDNGNKLQVRGNFNSNGIAESIRTTIVLAETFGVNDYTILANTGAGNMNVNIDPTTRIGKIGNVKKISADVNTVTLTALSGLIFDIGAGAATLVFNTQGENIQFQCDGTNIYIL